MATDLEKTRWEFVTRSENPSVYTKLSCFLPWIAEQYSLKFDDGRLEKECLTGTGGESKSATNRQKNEEEGNVCRIVPSTIIDLVFEGEFLCIFPYYFDGLLYTGCQMFNLGGFVIPIFKCPIRNITTKIDGINSFKSDPRQDETVYCLSTITSFIIF